MLTIGAKVRRARESKKPEWSQYDISEATGVSRSKLAAWETDRSKPKYEDLAKVAKALGIPIEWFYDGEDTVPPPAPTQSVVSEPKATFSYGMRNVRYAGVVPCGEWGDPLDAEDMVPIDAKYEHPRRFLTTVAGDSCYPAMQHGDKALWHHDLAPSPGLIVLAQRKGDHGCTVKQLKMDGEGTPHLHPINSAYGEPENGAGWGVIARLVMVERSTSGTERIFYNAAGLRPEDLA